MHMKMIPYRYQCSNPFIHSCQCLFLFFMLIISKTQLMILSKLNGIGIFNCSRCKLNYNCLQEDSIGLNCMLGSLLYVCIIATECISFNEITIILIAQKHTIQL